MQKKKLYLMPCNHFDLSWRRPFKKQFEFCGETYLSYADIQSFYIEDNIALCEKYPEYKFSIESVSVIREFLNRKPEYFDVLVKLSKKGRMFVPGSGEVIIDSNMVNGETLVRNYLLGLNWVKDNLGQDNISAYRADAFGNSAQLPQIFRNFGLKHAYSLDYVFPNGKYWRGLDGSTVVTYCLENTGNGGNPAKLVPCKNCNGTGTVNGETCPKCAGRQYDNNCLQAMYFPFQVDEQRIEECGVGYVKLAPEEYLPLEKTILRAKEFNKKYDVEFVNPEQQTEYFKDLTDNIDSQDLVNIHDSVELNPTQTGCLVSRIKTKQSVHKEEYKLLAAETLAVANMLLGEKYPQKEIENIWHKMFFVCFHDCITGTTVDAAYAELMQEHENILYELTNITENLLKNMAEEKPNTITVINPYGFKVNKTETFILNGKYANIFIDGAIVTDCENIGENTKVTAYFNDLQPFSATEFTYKAKKTAIKVTESKDNIIENQRYIISADCNGVTKIYDKLLKRTISKTTNYRPFEFIYEHDEGDPWNTLSTDRTRVSLVNNTKLIKTEIKENCQSFVFNIESPNLINQGDVEITYKISLIKGSNNIDVKADVNWDTFNRRLRVALPVLSKGIAKYTYGIPYGTLNRKEYVPYYGWSGADGDYPAQNFFGVDAGEFSVAMFNKGTPSGKVEMSNTIYGPDNDTMFMSLLRSPTIPCFLHEPKYYTMTDFNGMRDSGKHCFEFAVAAYNGSFAQNNTYVDAECFSLSLIVKSGSVKMPKLPTVCESGAMISSVKKAEKSDSLVLRIVEYKGKNTTVTINVPQNFKAVYKATMAETNKTPLALENGKVTVALNHNEIATLIFE